MDVGEGSDKILRQLALLDMPIWALIVGTCTYHMHIHNKYQNVVCWPLLCDA